MTIAWCVPALCAAVHQSSCRLSWFYSSPLIVSRGFIPVLLSSLVVLFQSSCRLSWFYSSPLIVSRGFVPVWGWSRRIHSRRSEPTSRTREFPRSYDRLLEAFPTTVTCKQYIVIRTTMLCDSVTSSPPIRRFEDGSIEWHLVFRVAALRSLCVAAFGLLFGLFSLLYC